MRLTRRGLQGKNDFCVDSKAGGRGWVLAPDVLIMTETTKQQEHNADSRKFRCHDISQVDDFQDISRTDYINNVVNTLLLGCRSFY